ncbi:MAG: glycosyltransferase [Acidobacteriota bacterium]|jgi:trehalose synthase
MMATTATDTLQASLDTYAEIAGEAAVMELRQLAAELAGATVVHVNSTASGGGVAEILTKLVPLTRELGIDAHWEVIRGEEDFFRCTKKMHNTLQGDGVEINDDEWEVWRRTNERNATEMRELLEEADFVFIHDPQPAALADYCPDRTGVWVWRCHIDVSRPQRAVWRRLRKHVSGYHASIFSLVDFARELPHPQYIVPPSIDPLSEKNVELEAGEIDEVRDRFGIDPDSPLLVQVSRFDRFKDPVGVIQAYRMASRHHPSLQLVLAGGGAPDDPEGEMVLREVNEAARGYDAVHVLMLPADAHRTINALQRAADIVLQKSTREGFGLTVTEALWKRKPVIGGNSGGIRIQVANHHTGFLVDTPEGAALRIRYLLQAPARREAMGRNGRELVRSRFLLTRQLREYLTLLVALKHRTDERIELRSD